MLSCIWTSQNHGFQLQWGIGQKVGTCFCQRGPGPESPGDTAGFGAGIVSGVDIHAAVSHKEGVFRSCPRALLKQPGLPCASGLTGVPSRLPRTNWNMPGKNRSISAQLKSSALLE